MTKIQAAAVAALLVAAACSAPSSSSSQSGTSAGGGSDTSGGASQGGAASDDTTGAPSTSSSSGGASSSSGGAAAGPTAAHLDVRLVDAPSTEVKSIIVTVAKVEAELASGWTTLVEKEQTIDLLTLQNGAFLSLGTATLPPGHVGQIRLYLAEDGDQHAVGMDDQSHPLTIPSGTQSGIKLVGGFEVPPCGVGQITLDFDGKKSLQVGGNGAGQWMLRPVLRLKAIVVAGSCPDPDAGGDAAAPLPDAGDDAAALPDPCAGVTCSDTEVCDNGSCRAL